MKPKQEIGPTENQTVTLTDSDTTLTVGYLVMKI